MPGKPHKTSFPEKAFTVKDGISLNSERECLNPASILTVSSTVNLFCWPAIVTDSFRDVFLSKSTRYGSFSIASDSPRRTSIHSHSIINRPAKSLNSRIFVTRQSLDTIQNAMKAGRQHAGQIK